MSPISTESAASGHASRDLRVFISNRESRCDECGEDLGRHAMIVLAGDRGALCLTCADLDHLWLLPPGDAALTRRARKYSTLAAVVLKRSRARKRTNAKDCWSRNRRSRPIGGIESLRMRARNTAIASDARLPPGARMRRWCGWPSSRTYATRRRGRRTPGARRRALGRARSRP